MHLLITTHLTLIFAKIASRVIKIRGYGGSTLPGFLIEKISPKSTAQILKLLPKEVIIVTGTNGKTTTTKIISDSLKANGKTVFTNAAGSNFTRGILSEVVATTSWLGKPIKRDYAVLELDEAYGKKFVKLVKPKYVVALNVLRDQLDRFGEIDQTAELIGAIMKQATEGCIVNGNEPNLVKISEELDVPIEYFGVDDELRKLFPTDDELLYIGENKANKDRLPVDVELCNIDGQQVSLLVDNKTYQANFKLRGVYNFLNSAAALSLLRQLDPEVGVDSWLTHVSNIQPAFGRGEVIAIGEETIEIVLVKNPAGFQQALRSYIDDAEIMIAINDNFADGKDISWLWDVNFKLMKRDRVSVVSGLRAYDMALRLQYDDIVCDKVYPDLNKALNKLIYLHKGSKRIYCNYTAMLQIRAELSKIVPLERVI